MSVLCCHSISQFIREGDLCFDIGANLGNRTDVFVALGAVSVAVELQDLLVKNLRRKYSRNRRVIIVHAAVGEKPGEAELLLCECHEMASLSKEWIDGISASGRVGDCRWDRSETVSVTTLDRLIEEYGKPAFCKIDVEGLELQVLKGLAEPIPALSFEYNPEFLDKAIACVRHVSGIGMDRFNYSVGESMHLSLERWVDAEEMCDSLRKMRDQAIYGDVYAVASREPYSPSPRETVGEAPGKRRS